MNVYHVEICSCLPGDKCTSTSVYIYIVCMTKKTIKCLFEQNCVCTPFKSLHNKYLMGKRIMKMMFGCTCNLNYIYQNEVQHGILLTILEGSIIILTCCVSVFGTVYCWQIQCKMKQKVCQDGNLGEGRHEKLL